MKIFERTSKPSVYDEPIATVLTEMNTYGPDSEEFPALLSYLERLTRLKSEQRSNISVSPDTIAVVAGNLLGILLIVAYEQNHVMVSKAASFALKPKDVG